MGRGCMWGRYPPLHPPPCLLPRDACPRSIPVCPARDCCRISPPREGRCLPAPARVISPGPELCPAGQRLSRSLPRLYAPRQYGYQELGSRKPSHSYRMHFIWRRTSLNEHSRAEALLNVQKKAVRNSLLSSLPC